VIPLVSAAGLTKHYATNGGVFLRRQTSALRAVDGVDLDIMPGETLGLVGESGCGKSTLGRTLIRLIEPTDGTILFDGADITALDMKAMRSKRRTMQIIFQDPYGALNPRMSVEDIIMEPLVIHGAKGDAATRALVADMLRLVGLPQRAASRFPHEFSGGQRQRVGIARALALKPRFVVCDEPVSALDVSVQAQIVNLLQDLQEQKGFSYLFIAHDLAVVRHIADRVMVMYLGRVVEIGPKPRIYSAPQHPYTQALLSAPPEPDPDIKQRRIVLEGDVPSPMRIPPGCSFHTRCPLAQDICRSERPALRDVAPGQKSACHFARPNPIPI
jgi:oligopeptide/dipeptide ABC transporter ATP-binding protein